MQLGKWTVRFMPGQPVGPHDIPTMILIYDDADTRSWAFKLDRTLASNMGGHPFDAPSWLLTRAIEWAENPTASFEDWMRSSGN